ncbi:MAG: NTP transferase domain-containing protein [Candidatus Nitrosocaldus sp.]
MIAVLMAGGRGSRLAIDEEKPLAKLDGRPMISYVMDALLYSKCFNTVIVAVSKNTPRTRMYLMNEYRMDHVDNNKTIGSKGYNNCNIRLVDTPGDGYSIDLNSIILEVKDHHSYRCGYRNEPYNLFVTPADLPLLDEHIVRSIVETVYKGGHSKAWVAVVTNKRFLDSLGVSNSNCFNKNHSTLCYTGISIVNTDGVMRVPEVVEEEHIIVDDVRVAVNVNRLEDLRMAASIKRLRIS